MDKNRSVAKGMKTGGRVKGTPNKTSGEIRTVLSQIVGKEIDRIPNHLNMIEPEKRLQILIKLLPYVIPELTNKPEEEKKESPINFFQQINDLAMERNASKIKSIHRTKKMAS